MAAGPRSTASVADPGAHRLGRPGAGFPRPWSIYRWIDGEHATLGRIADLTTFAVDLAGFLSALYAIDAADGPAPGTHNFSRGSAIDTLDAQTRSSIRLLADDIDAAAVTKGWDAALTGNWNRSPVWVHGDVTASNLLVADGRLRAVIDFGCAAVGDPACDLVMMWTFFTGESAQTFRNALSFDDATWARARGWALWKALRTLVNDKEGLARAADSARRFGWRSTAQDVVDAVLADHCHAG